MNKQLSIVISVYNKIQFTLSCLNDLFKLNDQNYQIIILDNASSDNTQKELSKIKQDNFLYIRNEENYFHSKACNQGYQLAKYDNVCFLNNDIRVKENYDNCFEALLENCEQGLVGPTMGQLDSNFNFVQEANKQLNGNSYISGWCIASSKKNWERLKIVDPITQQEQVWDERFPLYFNDSDLSMRARKLGIPLKTVSIPVVHFGKISTSQLNISKLYTDGKKVFTDKWKK